MKNNSLNPTQTLALAAGVACLASLTLPAAPEPYPVDADTLHLWHFDEVQNTNTTLPAFVVQDVSALSFYDLDVVNGAKVEAPAFSVALDGALDNRGIPGAPQYGAGALSEDNLFYYPDDFAGAGGAFTFEALVKPDFDPATPDVPRPPMQILSLENEGGTEARVFQFRLNSTTTNSQYALEFLNIGSAAAASNTPVDQPIQLPDANLEAWKTVGLGVVEQSIAPNVWSCPNRPGLAALNPNNNQWTLGYQYYGGIRTWNNNRGSRPSRSPIKTATSKPSWMLAADAVIRWDNRWSDPAVQAPSGFSSLQAHPDRSGLPEGGNEVFIDGHVEWIRAAEMFFLHSWNPGSRELYFYQQDLGEFESYRERGLKKIQ